MTKMTIEEIAIFINSAIKLSHSPYGGGGWNSSILVLQLRSLLAVLENKNVNP